MSGFKLRAHLPKLAVALVFFLFVDGCQSKGPKIKVGSVHGVVKCDGKPVPSGNVVFEDPGQGQLAAALLKSDGSYTVTTSEGGLRVGTYTVTVVPASVQIDPIMNPNAPKPVDPENIPAKYRDRSTSELSLVVKAGDNTLNIEMKK